MYVNFRTETLQLHLFHRLPGPNQGHNCGGEVILKYTVIAWKDHYQFFVVFFFFFFFFFFLFFVVVVFFFFLFFFCFFFVVVFFFFFFFFVPAFVAIVLSHRCDLLSITTLSATHISFICRLKVFIVADKLQFVLMRC